MPQNVTISETLTRQTETFNYSAKLGGDMITRLDMSVTTGTTPSFSFPVNQDGATVPSTQGIVIFSDQTVTVTFKDISNVALAVYVDPTHVAATATSITVSANSPFIWASQTKAFFSASATKVTIANSSGNTANVQLRMISNGLSTV
jgi:hypothetical protein